VLLPLSIAAWLTGRNHEISGRPIDVLRTGDVDRVLGLVRQLAADAAG
jgi:hypothetical protein